MNDFLNSKSMITPGVAGGLVTLIAATASSQFGMPAKWVALIASALIALFIFISDKAGPVAARMIVFVLNACIIFSVSVGTNTAIVAAKNARTTAPPYEEIPAQPTPTPFFHQWFTSSNK
jgi:hypothetical protein